MPQTRGELKSTRTPWFVVVERDQPRKLAAWIHWLIYGAVSLFVVGFVAGLIHLGP